MADPASPPRRAWLKWALVASLGLNLAGLGLVGGAMLHGPERMHHGPALWHYAHALPGPYRRDLGRALRASRRDWIEARQALDTQRAALAEAVAAEPFDTAAVTAVLAREAQLSGDLAQRGTQLLVAQIERMSPEERVDYARALREDGPRRHRRGP